MASGACLQEEIVVIEQTKEDGRKAQIVYRNGGIVSAAALEALCVRVHSQLPARSYALDSTRCIKSLACRSCLQTLLLCCCKPRLSAQMNVAPRCDLKALILSFLIDGNHALLVNVHKQLYLVDGRTGALARWTL